MATSFLLGLVACRDNGAKPSAKKIEKIYVHQTGGNFYDDSRVDKPLLSDSDLKLKISPDSDLIRLIIDKDISINRILGFADQIYRPKDTSIQIQLMPDEKDDGEHRKTRFDPVTANIEFPLADNNEEHWQYQIADLIRMRTPTVYDGVDGKSGIGYLVLTNTENGFYFGFQKVSISEFKEILAKKRSINRRTVVFIYVKFGGVSASEFVTMMAMIDQNKCKIIIER